MRTVRLVLAAAVACAAWSEIPAFDASAREKIALDAMRLAPPALRRQLARHSQALVQGAREAPPATMDAAVRKLGKEVDAVVAMINAHKSFRKISESLGRLSATAASLNNPLWSAPAAEAGGDEALFSKYFEENMTKFPLVFTGYDAGFPESGDVSRFAARIRDRYRQDSASLHRAYHPPDGGAVLPSDFDERSVPFAIASLSYSRAVTDTSQLWIHVWHRANGDLSGTPYFDPTLETSK